MPRWLSVGLKVGVTVGGLAYVLSSLSLPDLALALQQASWRWLSLAAGLMVASLALRAYRWYVLLRGLGVAPRFGRLVRLYFVGNFFNSFLPSGFGGDVVRAVEATRDMPAQIAAGAVIVDRLTGLLMLFVMALAMLPWRPADFPDGWLRLIVLICLVGLAGGAWLLEGRQMQRGGEWLARWPRLAGLFQQAIRPALQAVQGCGRPALGQALAVSLVFNLMLVAWWLAAGRALGHSVPYTYFLLAVPLLSIALLVPSISGLGVSELLAPALFAGAGLSPESAVAMSLLVFLLLRLTSLLGAPVYILDLWQR